MSVVVNAIGLFVVASATRAPPRLALYVCLVSMFAVLLPWALIGSALQYFAPSYSIQGATLFGAATVALRPHYSSVTSLETVLFTVWLVVAGFWTTGVFVRSFLTRRAWRFDADVADALARYGDTSFSAELRRASIYRLSDTSSVFTTGLLRPEIWIGKNIRTETQIRAALNHELSHIASHDQVSLLCIVVMERLLWWNPLIWLLGRQARLQMEYACDSQCASLFGADEYRNTLAELFLGDLPKGGSLAIPLGNRSDLITRMEKIGMRKVLKPRYVLSTAVGLIMIAVASSNMAGQSDPKNQTLLQCHKLLPSGVQYDFEITSDIDTRDGQKGALSVSLIDTSNPDSEDLPDGAGPFLQCVQKVVGLENEDSWPDA